MEETTARRKGIHKRRKGNNSKKNRHDNGK